MARPGHPTRLVLGEGDEAMKLRTGLAVVLIVALRGTAAAGQSEVDRAYAALSQRTRDIVETYLRTDCEIGEVGAALKPVLAVADSAKPDLIAVQRGGPPSAVLNDFQRGLESTWQARQEYLKTRDARELGNRSFEVMKAITKEQYVKEQNDEIGRASCRERV